MCFLLVNGDFTALFFSLTVPRGKRQWKAYYAYLKGFLLYFAPVSQLYTYVYIYSIMAFNCMWNHLYSTFFPCFKKCLAYYFQVTKFTVLYL